MMPPAGSPRPDAATLAAFARGLEDTPRPRGGGPAPPGPDAAAPVQPRRVRECDSRPAGPRDRRVGPAAAGRLQLRLRQHRRHPRHLAPADGALRCRCRAHQRAGGRRSLDRPEFAAVPRQLRFAAARAHQRAADRHARRHRVPPPLPPRRRVRRQAAVVEDERRLRPRAANRARPRGQHRRSAGAADARRRSERLPDERAQLGGRGNGARNPTPDPDPGDRGAARRGGDVPGAGRRCPDRPRRAAADDVRGRSAVHPRRTGDRARDHRRALQPDRPRRHAEPPRDLHLQAGHRRATSCRARGPSCRA